MTPDDGSGAEAPDQTAARQMSAELIALLRQRVAARFYDQPTVVDVIARRIARAA